MSCIKMRKLLPAVMVSCLLTAQASADGFYWAQEGAGTPDSGSGTSFRRSQMSLTLPLENKKSQTESFKSSVHLDITEFDWEGTTALMSEYYWLSVPMEYRQKRGRNGEFIIRAEPGFMTDLNVLDGDSLAMNVDLIGRIHQRSGAYWELGLTVNREFGNFSPRPVIGLAWKPTRATEMLLGFPRTLIQTRWSQEVNTFLHIRPEGGAWQEEIVGQTGTYRATYTNWKLGVGGEFHWRGAMWLRGEIGQLRNRRVKATDDTGTSVAASPGADRFWQLGVEFRY